MSVNTQQLKELYTQRGHDWIVSHCWFCESELPMDADGMYDEEVGEVWSETLENTVLTHPDCVPDGWDAIAAGENPEWKPA